MRDWIEEYLPGLLIAGCLVLLGGVCWLSSRDVDQRCARLMALARSPHDSLTAQVACERIASDASRDMAIGFAAGAVAGSASGGRR